MPEWTSIVLHRRGLRLVETCIGAFPRSSGRSVENNVVQFESNLRWAESSSDLTESAVNTRKYLLWRHAVRTERSEVRAAWRHNKYFPYGPNSRLIRALLNTHTSKLQKVSVFLCYYGLKFSRSIRQSVRRRMDRLSANQILAFHPYFVWYTIIKIISPGVKYFFWRSVPPPCEKVIFCIWNKVY